MLTRIVTVLPVAQQSAFPADAVPCDSDNKLKILKQARHTARNLVKGDKSHNQQKQGWLERARTQNQMVEFFPRPQRAYQVRSRIASRDKEERR
jgi:hypothetical protein